MTEPSRTVEVERKYDADPDTPLPLWDGIPGVLTVSSGEERALDARYFDTGDFALARAGMALRRRTGGHDAGWHLKGPRRGDGRVEWGWPLGDEEVLPPGLAEEVSRWTADPVVPIARVENARTAYYLSGPDGVVAEFVDDRVHATDLLRGTRREWREWEMELGAAAPTDLMGRVVFFSAVDRAVHAAGGRPASSASKLGRALGL
ncbi:inorganic triphosphatase YgiF [Microbacterium resistens]|uniref:Inorganic triphosphatase YgiF n=1 Tax=Microbacterium resistens TaxID=156977 RepID=A0ABU1SDY0_9MICO|nr:CYTH domain-containing protein [Microbacterium resistens]MDR6867782.1 inorganic triphosphatase YgiF [Microbacterium resistens]